MMASKVRLKVYNSFSRRKEIFKPAGKKVGIYVCGITPYEVTHLGHAFTYTFFDVVIRYLRYLGYQVIYLQNLTDIDDDILKKAKELKVNWRMLAQKNTEIFLRDNQWLGNQPPDIYCRASDHIDEMIKIIKKLIKKKVAYEKNGNVYFESSKFKNYGQLSKLSRKQMIPIANQRGNNPRDPNKRDPLDFVLWQAQKAGEPAWPSPWGVGRPGWHIECTAMEIKYLGATLDFHGGGADLIFPHHESSLAQSQVATGKKFVNYWLHTAMLRCQGKKMSKSIGNLVLIKQLKEKYRPNEVRISLLSHHYRQAWQFDWSSMTRVKKLNQLFKKVWLAPASFNLPLNFTDQKNKFFQALNDDFNFAQGLKVLADLAKKIIKNHQNYNTASAKAFLNQAFNILGLTMEYV